jgi:hypothetical protein
MFPPFFKFDIMKTKNHLFIVVFLFFSLAIYSQEISNTNAFVITQLAQLNTNPNYVIDNTTTTPSNNNLNVNSVVELNQLGNFNAIDLKTNLNDSQTVNQIGNKNNYVFINYFNSNPSNMNIVQQGNDNFLQVYGQNSIMSKISIIQKTNAKTLIIKNY